MKRKPDPSSRPAQAAPQPQAVPAPPPGPSVLDRGFVWAFPVLLFFAMTVQTVTASLVLAAAAVALSVGKGGFARLRSRMCLPVWGFLAFLILCLAGSLYTSFGTYAYSELFKLLTAGAMGWLLLSRGRRENVRQLVWGFCAVCAVIALLCLDSACEGPLFRGFAALMEALGNGGYLELEQAAYTGARFDGIYNDANLTGSLLALAILAGVYLLRTESCRWKRGAASLLAGVSAVSFLTAMSRGAILCFGAAVLVYLIAAGKGNRLALFSTLLATAVTMGVFGAASMTLLAAGSFAGTLIALPSGLLLWLLEEIPGRKLAAVLEGKTRLLAVIIAVLAAAVAAAAVLALTLTEPFQLTGENLLYRGAAVEPGQTYTLTGDWDNGEELTVVIYGSTLEEELTGRTTRYYEGSLAEASFNVPEGVEQVLLQVRGPAGTELRSLALSDGTEIPMAYTLLPENIVSRFQKNLFQDSSFLLRVQYVKDGWTLFTQSPLIGHGLGATEGWLTSVQPFFYESLYLHNHILQVMDETGLLGLAAFLALLGGNLWLLIRRLRRDRDPLSAALLACWAMMNLHGLMEISFSVGMFQCAAFFLLLLPVVCREETTAGRKAVRTGGAVVALVWLTASAILLGCSAAARNKYASLDTSGMSRADFMAEMESLDRLDLYTDQDYKVNLMGNAIQEGGTLNQSLAARCARELRETGDFDACYKAAAYYYLPLGNLPEFFACVQEGLDQERSNPDAWASAFDLYRQAFAQLDESRMEDFISGVTATGERMDQANEALLVDVALDENGQRLLDTCRSIQDQGLDDTAAYGVLTALLSAEQADAEEAQ